jgi:hypothetical protein
MPVAAGSQFSKQLGKLGFARLQISAAALAAFRFLQTVDIRTAAVD